MKKRKIRIGVSMALLLGIFFCQMIQANGYIVLKDSKSSDTEASDSVDISKAKEAIRDKDVGK